MVTDIRWRRIPNFLTLPALCAALIVRTAIQGWSGLGLALAGAVISPLLLLLMHGGRGLGMGDLKLAVAIGAIAGPVMAAAMMLLSAVIGGIQAIVVMYCSGGLLSQLLGTFFIGFPFVKKTRTETKKEKLTVRTSPKMLTMPYGVAIGIGSLLTLVVSWWTGREDWILSLVKIAANQ
jgi:prepilin peptidase CpaA